MQADSPRSVSVTVPSCGDPEPAPHLTPGPAGHTYTLGGDRTLCGPSAPSPHDLRRPRLVGSVVLGA